MQSPQSSAFIYFEVSNNNLSCHLFHIKQKKLSVSQLNSLSPVYITCQKMACQMVAKDVAYARKTESRKDCKFYSLFLTGQRDFPWLIFCLAVYNRVLSSHDFF